MTTQPEALRLADALDHPPGAPLFTEAAAELRRLHDEMLYPDRIASDLQDTCHAQAKRIAEQDALLRQSMEALDELMHSNSTKTAQHKYLAVTDAIRQHLEGKQ